MKYIILYGMCIIAQMLLFTGCEDKEQASPYLALDKDELSQSFAATAGTKEITLFLIWKLPLVYLLRKRQLGAGLV